METRTITQVRIYKLILNPMAGCAETAEIVAISTDYNKLVDWYRSQLAAEPRREDTWYKVFIPGPLEWYNPVKSLELNNLGHFGHGIADEWLDEKMYRYGISSNICYVVE